MISGVFFGAEGAEIFLEGFEDRGGESGGRSNPQAAEGGLRKSTLGGTEIGEFGELPLRPPP